MGVDSAIGSVVGGFRIAELLARGAMGAVYLAEDADRRRVALKVLSVELAHDERFRQRFLRESRLAATLDHPNVVPTLGSGEDAGALYLAMDTSTASTCGSSCAAKVGSIPSVRSGSSGRRARRSTRHMRPGSSIAT